MDDPDEKSPTSLVRYLPLLVVACGLAFGYAMGWHHYLSLEFLAESRDSLKASVADNPLLAPLVFVLLYALAVAFSFPAASVLTVFAGFLFGWFLGGALVAVMGKLKRLGRFEGMRPSWKKAVVTLAEGDTIDIVVQNG